MFYSSVKSKNIQLIEQANRIVVTKGPRGDGEKLINGTRLATARGGAMLVLFYAGIITVGNTVSLYIHNTCKKILNVLITKKCEMFSCK